MQVADCGICLGPGYFLVYLGKVFIEFFGKFGAGPDNLPGQLSTSNGEVRQEFSIVLTARPLSDHPTPSSETSDLRWVPEAELSGYTMDRSMRIRINDFLARAESPVIT